MKHSTDEELPVDQVEHKGTYPVGAVTSDQDHGFSLEEQKRIMWRLDRRLVPVLGVMYCVSLMDRTNLGAANIAGMSKELMLIGDRYSIISLVFFITYIIFQPPSTVIVRALGPRVHLPTITTLWGGCMIGMGFVTDWKQMAGLRLVLGILEAGFFPSCVYLLSTWYTRFEMGKRYSVFYLLGSFASATSGILAYGFMQMSGLGGQTGWRWIFIMFGLITVAIGVMGFWGVVDFPDSKRSSWRFLSARERAWVVAKVNTDRGDAKIAAFKLGHFMRAGLDWKIWCYALIFFNTTTISYALAYFLPIILNQSLGFSIAASQCLVAPPYLLAAIVMWCTGWLGDRYRMRGVPVLIHMALCIIGLPIVGWHRNPAVRYFGVFLVTAGANANVPATMSYQANNIRGQWKRAFCSATLVGFGGIGGIAGSLVFRNQDKPTYLPGLWACIACSLLNVLLVGLLTVYFKIENRRADRGEKELETSDEDYQPGFRYTC
ncbi:unnamed protein product [Discula destructiva]